MKKYDVGVIDFGWGMNYGSLINGYATRKILRDLGLSVLTIQKPGANEDDWELKDTHNRKFGIDHYGEDISPFLPLSRMNELNDLCDTFIAASDQIFNPYFSGGWAGYSFYLDFVAFNKKKISFATSFGTSFGSYIKNSYIDKKEKITGYFKRFSSISVREKASQDILRNTYGIDSTVVMEPVFFMDDTEWAKLAAYSEKKEIDMGNNYLLTYILDPTPEKRSAINYYSEKTGLKNINILNGRTDLWANNNELLNLEGTLSDVHSGDLLKAFMNASFVITDSFHGMVLSIIFSKRFITIANKRRGFDRFEEVLSNFDLMDRLIVDESNIEKDEKYLELIDYTKSIEIIKTKKEKSIDWLKNALDAPTGAFSSVTVKHIISNVLPTINCTGCSACINTCPTKSLGIVPDEVGYYRSVLTNKKTCIKCGKCTDVCPAKCLPINQNDSDPKCYAFIASNKDILFNSSSGGVFSLLAKQVFLKKGAVAGVAWREDFSVEHILIDNEQDLYKIQKSKYMQSFVGDVFIKIKGMLDNNIFVLFSGCPCQVAGLKAYLEKDYCNLLLVDLLCGNSPSAFFFKKYIEEDFGKIGLKNYEFRHKVKGWNSDCLTLTLADGTVITRRGGRQDNYQRVYHDHTMCPYHCENCRYQTLPRFGDLTIGDFWNINEKDDSINTQKGVSVILANNKKGYDFLYSIPSNEFSLFKEVPLEWLDINGYALKGKKNYASPYRDYFYDAIKNMQFSKALEYALYGKNFSKKELLAQKRNELIFKSKNKLIKMSRFKIYHINSYNRNIKMQLDSRFFDEKNENNVFSVMVKNGFSKKGVRAYLLLNHKLQKSKRYVFYIRFKIISDSPIINFHISNFKYKEYQNIATCKLDMTEIYEINSIFYPNSNNYDSIMFSALHITGEGNKFTIERIFINEMD